MDPLTVFLTLASLSRRVVQYHRNKEADRYRVNQNSFDPIWSGNVERFNNARSDFYRGYGSTSGNSLFNGYYPSILDDLKSYVSSGGADAPVDSSGHTAGDYTVQFRGTPESGYEAYRGLSGSGKYSEYLGHYDAPDIDLTKPNWSK